MATKTQTIYLCTHCDTQYPAWQGRCTECGQWSTIVSSEKEAKPPMRSVGKLALLTFEELDNRETPRIETCITELDLVLGGGLVPGSLILLGGTPGIGKSTLALQLLHALSTTSKTAKQLYISGEESPSQLKMRADRLGLKNTVLTLFTNTRVEKIIAAIEQLKPQITIIDSIQTISSDEVIGEPGNITQIKACTTKLLEAAKKTNSIIVITGHVTKDGLLAGPKALEHLVDVVLYLEGEKNTLFRILRSNKNRFGATNEIGVFEMTSHGLAEVKNPSLYFLEKALSIPGTCTSTALQGNKVFFLEIQALVAKTHFGNPVRKSSGYDINRLGLLTAVMSNRMKLPLQNYDVYLNIVGGVKFSDPALDLAVCFAILSALKNKKTPDRCVIFGEVGLGGEVRSVFDMEKRIRESKKLQFHPILAPSLAKSKDVICVQHITKLIEHLE